MKPRPFALSPDREGLVVRGDVWLPAGGASSSAIVVVHGFKGFKDWGFFPYLCRTLAQDGHAVVGFNFSRNGIGGDPLAFTEMEAFARNTLTRELDELLRVLEATRAGDLLNTPPSTIGLLGYSRGGGDAILAAGEDGQIDALVTWSAVAEFDRWDSGTKEEWRRRGRIHVPNSRTGQDMPVDVVGLEDFEANRERLDILGAAASLTVPWLIVHGEADATVPVEEARSLQEASSGARLEIIPAAGHTLGASHPFGSATAQLDRAIEMTAEHFRRCLSPDSPERGRRS